MNSVELGGWNGTVSAVPDGWTLAEGATVETDGMTAPTVDPGKSVDLLTGSLDGFFTNATINGENKVLAVNIDPSILNPEDKEMIEDLIMIAVNDAIDKADELKKDRFGSMASAMGLPLK